MLFVSLQNWNEMEYAIVQLFVFLIFCVTDTGFAMFRHFNDVHDQVGCKNESTFCFRIIWTRISKTFFILLLDVAHFCGAVAGLLVGIGVLRNLKVRPWERKLWWCAVTLYFLLMISGISIHIFYKDHFPFRQSYKGQFEWKTYKFSQFYREP